MKLVSSVYLGRLSYLALLGIVIASTSCKLKPTAVETVQLEEGEVRQTVRILGRVQSATRRVIGAPYDGHVEDLKVASGQKVERGQVVLVMRSKDIQTKIEKIKSEIQNLELQKATSSAQLKKLEADLKRSRIALKSRAIASNEVEELEVQKVIAENRIRAHQVEIDEAKKSMITLNEQIHASDLTSPIAGKVSETWISKNDFTAGTVVKAGDPLVTLIEGGELKMRAVVPEYFALQLSEGQSLQLHSPALAKKEWPGVVQTITTQNDKEGLFEVVVRFTPEGNNLRLGSEIIASATVAYKQSVNSLPKTAVVKIDNDYFVHVVDKANGNTELSNKVVEVGVVGDERVEIVSGVEASDLIAKVY